MQIEQVATDWSKQLGGSFKPEGINCGGCPAESGRLFQPLPRVNLRACGAERAAANCSACPEYGCEKIIGFSARCPAPSACWVGSRAKEED